MSARRRRPFRGARLSEAPRYKRRKAWVAPKPSHRVYLRSAGPSRRLVQSLASRRNLLHPLAERGVFRCSGDWVVAGAAVSFWPCAPCGRARRYCSDAASAFPTQSASTVRASSRPCALADGPWPSREPPRHGTVAGSRRPPRQPTADAIAHLWSPSTGAISGEPTAPRPTQT
jgi:hypothetical protein